MTKIIGQPNLKLTITKGESDRLAKIIACDEIIIMPGGTGTLEELLFVNETSRSNEHKKNITLVNIDGFYNGLLQQINTNIREGLSKTTTIRFKVVNSVDQLSI